VTLVVVYAALVTIFVVAYSGIIIEFFWAIVGGLLVMTVCLVLLHRKKVHEQVVSRPDVVQQVSEELCANLEACSSEQDVGELRRSLHASCRPYLDEALALLKKRGLIE
jgi:hypothetical protein